jgi:hypothetical protein
VDIGVGPSSLIDILRGGIQIVIHKVAGRLVVDQLKAINLLIVKSDNNNSNHHKDSRYQIKAFKASTLKHAQFSDQELHLCKKIDLKITTHMLQ